jgi:hypothetical protein
MDHARVANPASCTPIPTAATDAGSRPGSLRRIGGATDVIAIAVPRSLVVC